MRALVGLTLLVACQAAPSAERHAPAPAPVDAAPDPPSAAPPPALAPLTGAWMEKLALPNDGLAYVAPPIGTTSRRPVIVAVHGAIDDSGLICSAWRIIADVYPFVLCPSGSRVRKDTYVWPSSEAIDQTIDRALAALQAKYGPYIEPGPALYVAFSQGANLAGPVLAKMNRGRFGAAVLTEGGYRAFETGESARAFTAAGGKRVLFTCSQAGCATWFGGSPLLRDPERGKVVYAGNHGHSMVPKVRTAIHEALPWVIEGLPGWSSYAEAPKLADH